MSGLVAVAAGGWGDADSERIRREVERILLLNERGGRFGSLAGRWAAKVAAKVVAAAAGGNAFVSGAVEATLESVAEGFTGHRQQKASQWYRSYPNAGGSSQRGLILLYEKRSKCADIVIPLPKHLSGRGECHGHFQDCR